VEPGTPYSAGTVIRDRGIFGWLTHLLDRSHPNRSGKFSVLSKIEITNEWSARNITVEVMKFGLVTLYSLRVQDPMLSVTNHLPRTDLALEEAVHGVSV